MYKKGSKMKRIQGFYDFLCKMEKSCAGNVLTAPTYFAELYESGAKEVLTLCREEYERRFSALINIQKK